MKLTSLVAPMSALVVLSCLVLPASAEQRRGSTGRASGQAVARAPRAGGAGSVSPGRVAAGQRGSRPPVRHAAPPRVAVPRGAMPYRSYAPRPPYAYARPYHRSYSYGYPYRYVWPYSYPVYARPYYYPAPYYTFRPRIGIGVGVWVGYPVAFPYSGYDYGYGYGSAAPYVAPYGTYGYRVTPPVDVGLVPGAAAHGGVSFDLSPAGAEVFVDGAYAGTVDDFTPNRRPLTLTPGPHRIEVHAPGYEPLVLDITVVAGEVTPYRGALQPVRP